MVIILMNEVYYLLYSALSTLIFTIASVMFFLFPPYSAIAIAIALGWGFGTFITILFLGLRSEESQH